MGLSAEANDGHTRVEAFVGIGVISVSFNELLQDRLSARSARLHGPSPEYECGSIFLLPYSERRCRRCPQREDAGKAPSSSQTGTWQAAYLVWKSNPFPATIPPIASGARREPRPGAWLFCFLVPLGIVYRHRWRIISARKSVLMDADTSRLGNRTVESAENALSAARRFSLFQSGGDEFHRSPKARRALPSCAGLRDFVVRRRL